MDKSERGITENIEDMNFKSGSSAGSSGKLKFTDANSTASALASEFDADHEKLNELKRRKIQDSSADQAGPRIFNASLLNESPLERSDGIARVGPLLRWSFDESRPVKVTSFLDDGPASKTSSKMRVWQTEGIKCEQGMQLTDTRSTDDRSPSRDDSLDYEPRQKKIRVTTKLACPPEGKSRKSLAIRTKQVFEKFLEAWKRAEKSNTKLPKMIAALTKECKKSSSAARSGVRLEVQLSAPGSNREEGEFTRKHTLLSWLIDKGAVTEHEKVCYLHKKDLHCMNEGYVTREGILCNCCRKIVTLSVFEAHARSKCKRPSANIYLDDGRSLSLCHVEAFAVKTRKKTDHPLDDGRLLSVCHVKGPAVKTRKETDHDHTCGICGDGGELICCDRCPSTFNLTCMGLHEVLNGDWYCAKCQSASCGGSEFGKHRTVHESDDTCGTCGDGGELICCDRCPSTFHLTCMGLHEVPDGDWYCPKCRCASCGGSEYNGVQTAFNDSTLIFCDHCERAHHVKCLRARGLNLSFLPREVCCGESCPRIFDGLRSLVGISKPMEGGFSWTLLRSGAEDDKKSGCSNANADINAEHDSKLSIALSVMQEYFRPMIDPRTQIDLITHVLYNRRSDISRLNYHGFFIPWSWREEMSSS